MTTDGEKQKIGRQSIFTEDVSPFYFSAAFITFEIN